MTCAMKNLMGIVWDRRYFHKNNLQQCIADSVTIRKPDLNIVCNIVSKKESLLKELFANANLSYTSLCTDLDAQTFLQLVNEWTEGKIKCTAN